MIPKKIHYIWLGKGQKSDKVEKCIASWQQHLSRFDIKEWNEHDLDYEAELERYPFLKELHKRKGWEYLSDYFRVKVLYEQGGIYLDTDMEVLKDLTPLLKNKFFVGMETDTNKTDTGFIGKVILGTAIIGATKNHPLLKANLSYYREKFPKSSEHYTNTVILTQLLKERYKTKTIKLDYPDAKVYDKSYFYSFNHLEESFDAKKITPHTYTIHWWTIDWQENNELLYYLRSKHLTGIKKFFWYINFKIKTLLSKMKSVEEHLSNIEAIKRLKKIRILVRIYKAIKKNSLTLIKSMNYFIKKMFSL